MPCFQLINIVIYISLTTSHWSVHPQNRFPFLTSPFFVTGSSILLVIQYYLVFWFKKVFSLHETILKIITILQKFLDMWFCFWNISTANILSSCCFDQVIEITICIVFLSPFFNQTDTKINTLKHFIDQNLLNKNGYLFFVLDLMVSYWSF